MEASDFTGIDSPLALIAMFVAIIELFLVFPIKHLKGGQTRQLLRGFVKYFSSSFGNQDISDVRFDLSHSLTPENIKNDNWQVYEGWADASLQLRKKFPAKQVDNIFRITFQSLGKNTTITESIRILDSKFATKFGPKGGAEVRRAFKAKGAVIS